MATPIFTYVATLRVVMANWRQEILVMTSNHIIFDGRLLCPPPHPSVGADWLP